jgi:hypothetical protein
MVNGLENVYRQLENKQTLTTMRILINSLYSDWENINTRVRQIMEVDSVINSLEVEGENSETIKRSMEYNVKSIVSAIRLFKELDIDDAKLTDNDITNDQKLLINIYRIIKQKKHSAFNFTRVESACDIDDAIQKALKYKHSDLTMKDIDIKTIVIHGVHQFSPAMLCAIEDISKHKDVVLMFNYQQQYQAIYQTWLNIYSLFETRILMSTVGEFCPTSLLVDSYPSNMLADGIGSLANGKYQPLEKAFQELEVIEFENLTEFAGYCSVLFEKASLKKKQRPNDKTPTLYYMPEQLYSASGKVNDILRAYFPEQFGERHFLDYPLGHFFVSAINMWDYENAMVRVDNLSDIKECFSAGIIAEKKHGQLLNTLHKVESFINKEISLERIIKILGNDLKKLVIKRNDKLRRISYINVNLDELQDLIVALKELNSIIHYFFSDFNEGADNFQRLYNRIHDFIVNRIQNQDELDDEMKNVINGILNRLENTDLPETGTFTCLKQTMEYYLSQDDSLGKSANWIVRDFEQIDGDILRSQNQSAKNIDTCYHFCSLSDKDLSATREDKLPWPLDIHFFEAAYEPLDWKYRIFLKSKMEFRNFKRYALLYGLEFNRLSCKLSYVKTENKKDNELYYLLSILGIKVKKYHSTVDEVYLSKAKYTISRDNPLQFKKIDFMRYNMCPYRFALESVVQEKTIYRDRFLIIWYMRILLQSAMKGRMQSEKFSKDTLKRCMEEEYDKLDSEFKITNELEKTQIISSVYKNMIEGYNKIKRVEKESSEEREIREDFLTTKPELLKYKADEVDLGNIVDTCCKYPLHYNEGCKYCASKDICLHSEK